MVASCFTPTDPVHTYYFTGSARDILMLLYLHGRLGSSQLDRPRKVCRGTRASQRAQPHLCRERR